MLKHARWHAARRELSAAQRIPYTGHVSATVIKTSLGDYVQAFRLAGVSFESSDDDQLNNWHEKLNAFWRNIATPQVAIWTYVIRSREKPMELQPESAQGRRGANGFAVELEEKYQQQLLDESLMSNALYLAIVYRPTTAVATGWLASMLARPQASSGRLELAEALDACEKLADQVRAALARYEPEALGVYEAGNLRYSALVQFLGLLVDGVTGPAVLPRRHLGECLASGRVFFGHEAIEYRLPEVTRVAAMLGIREYPTPSGVGMFNRLLTVPFSFVLTQSFTFLNKSTGQALLQRQFNRMANAGDFAISQAEALKDALDSLTSNEFVMGDHHFSLQVIVDVPEPGDRIHEQSRFRHLNDCIAQARSILADTGMTVAREDLALEGAFWAQLPGNFPFRPRKAPMTSRNLAGMAAFHNFPRGRPNGNHWGNAMTTLVTSATSPFYFSLHASDPSAADGGSRKDTGHTLICGPTGSGKTVFIGFLIALLTRQDVTQVIFDKDRGLEILVRALGGEYLPLRNGEHTGFNPLQLPMTTTNIEFMKLWLRELVHGPGPAFSGAGGSPKIRHSADLDQALHGTLALPAGQRRLSRLIEFLDPTDPEGMHASLAPWCESTDGDYGWVFDNPADTILPRMGSGTLIGFDVTDFLDHPRTRTPVTLYLFHLVRQLLDGRKLVCWMDEFWRLLADPAFEKFAKDGPKTWRKLNGVMCLATQSVGDVLESPISRTLTEQTPTKVFFPNADANAEDYIQGFGLSEREFRLIKERLEPGSRMFLVKQSHHSVVCKLDLKGFDAELSVISGRATQVRRMHELIAAYGADPARWVPRLLSESTN
jgi:type IV secretion system protein VirB4